jgi:hypothetical protein
LLVLLWFYAPNTRRTARTIARNSSEIAGGRALRFHLKKAHTTNVMKNAKISGGIAGLSANRNP